MRIHFVVLGLMGAGLLAAQTNEELNFTGAIGELKDLPGGAYAALMREANEHLARRPKLDSLAALQERGAAVRRQMLANIGGLPEKTPLRARLVGMIDRENYRIEKVIFESQPNFFVTGSLYLPKKGKGPYPAILFPLGHEAGAKAHEAWQYVLGSFATKGFVAFAWDPLGQGERSQFFDADTRSSRLVQSTREHSMLGAQCLLTGDSVARYIIHDGIRALDYLLSRPEVDPKRVGVTGNSGGGTATTYLAAIDDRLQVAAPSCYITSWSRLLAQLGPQDAEQNLPPWLNLGFDFPDFIYAASPKPYLVLSAIRDFFPIGGARATFAEAERTYDSLGIGERLKMVEADDGHGYTLPRRLAAYSWMSRWLKNSADDGVEPVIPLATEQELYCTTTGQVATSLGGETVYSLNRKRAAAVKPAMPVDVIATARKLSGFQPIQGIPPVANFGVLRKQVYRVEKLVYESEPGVRIPAVLAIPDGETGKRAAVLYIDGKGKAAARMEQWISEGKIVLAIDARGFGELATRPNASQQWLGDASLTTTALLLNKTLVGLRATDIVRGLELLAGRPEVDASRIDGVGVGSASVPLLFATAFDSRLRSVTLDGLLRSYQDAVDSRLHRRVYEHVIPGVLKHFDLPDLVAAIGPKRLTVRSRVDAMGEAVR